jgi:ribosome-binding factor A
MGEETMSTHSRPDRVGEEIRAAIGEMLTRGELRDPRIGFITITGVKMSPDLRVAKVFYSMIGSDKQREDTQLGLDAAKGFVRREVTSRVKLRVSPEIYFAFDASVGEGDKIDRLLREVKEKEGW